MKIVSFKASDLKPYTIDNEMLQKAARPCVLIVRLKYKNKRYDFAVPLRSNIPPASPKNHYFPLPPRKTTKSKHRHGIHYIKMFPIDKRKAYKYRTEGNSYATFIKNIINANEKRIIKDCQRYLNEYEHGNKPKYSTDLDLLIKTLGL